MELIEIKYQSIYGAVGVQILDCACNCIRTITRLFIELFENKY